MIVADSVAAATEVLASSAPLDLVISDLIMASGGGELLLAKVRQLRPHLLNHFAFLTGMARAGRLPPGPTPSPSSRSPSAPTTSAPCAPARRLSLTPPGGGRGGSTGCRRIPRRRRSSPPAMAVARTERGKRPGGSVTRPRGTGAAGRLGHRAGQGLVAELDPEGAAGGAAGAS